MRSRSCLNELGWKDATLEYLSRLPVRAWPTRRELARRLSISEQFYRRHLLLEGASYRALKQELRLERAIQLLGSGRYRNLAEVAHALDFCDEQALRRMVKRCAGCSATEFFVRKSSR